MCCPTVEQTRKNIAAAVVVLEVVFVVHAGYNLEELKSTRRERAKGQKEVAGRGDRQRGRRQRRLGRRSDGSLLERGAVWSAVLVCILL